MPQQPSAARRVVLTFGWASLLHDLGADMVFSVWPLYVTGVLGASPAVLGLIDGIGDAAVAISQAAAGYASDRIRRRKPFIWIGYLCGGIARAGYALSHAWPLLIPFRILDRSGKMRGAPRDAVIADVVPPSGRAAAFGLQRMMDNLGAVGGILLSIVLVQFVEFRTLFLLAALPSLAAALLILRRVPESASPERLFTGMRFRDIGRPLWVYLGIIAVFELGAFSYSFLLLYAHGTVAALGAVPALYLLYNIVAAACSVPMGRLADRIGRRPVLALSFLLWMATLALLLTGGLGGVIAGFVCYGMFKAASDPVRSSLVTELAPKGREASALGGFQMVVGLVSFPSSFLAGVLWQLHGPHVPLLVSLCLAAAALAFVPLLRERRGGATIPA